MNCKKFLCAAAFFGSFALPLTANSSTASLFGALARGLGRSVRYVNLQDHNEGYEVAVEQGITDVNAKDEDGNTVLMHVASENTNSEIIKVLIDAGADVNAKNELGLTAKDYAKENKNPEIIKILSEKK